MNFKSIKNAGYPVCRQAIGQNFNFRKFKKDREFPRGLELGHFGIVLSLAQFMDILSLFSNEIIMPN